MPPNPFSSRKTGESSKESAEESNQSGHENREKGLFRSISRRLSTQRSERTSGATASGSPGGKLERLVRRASLAIRPGDASRSKQPEIPEDNRAEGTSGQGAEVREHPSTLAEIEETFQQLHDLHDLSEAILNTKYAHDRHFATDSNLSDIEDFKDLGFLHTNTAFLLEGIQNFKERTGAANIDEIVIKFDSVDSKFDIISQNAGEEIENEKLRMLDEKKGVILKGFQRICTELELNPQNPSNIEKSFKMNQEKLWGTGRRFIADGGIGVIDQYVKSMARSTEDTISSIDRLEAEYRYSERKYTEAIHQNNRDELRILKQDIISDSSELGVWNATCKEKLDNRKKIHYAVIFAQNIAERQEMGDTVQTKIREIAQTASPLVEHARSDLDRVNGVTAGYNEILGEINKVLTYEEPERPEGSAGH